MIDEKKIRQIYGIYAFVRKDFVHPPMPDLSRCLKADGGHPAGILIEYE